MKLKLLALSLVSLLSVNASQAQNYPDADSMAMSQLSFSQLTLTNLQSMQSVWSKVQGSYPQGVVMDGVLSIDEGAPEYELTLWDGSKLSYVRVNAESGKVYPAQTEHSDEALTLPVVSLSRAVDAAQTHTGGSAISAMLEPGDSHAYRVETIQGNQSHWVTVSGDSAKVLAVESEVLPAEELRLLSALPSLSVSLAKVSPELTGKLASASTQFEEGDVSKGQAILELEIWDKNGDDMLLIEGHTGLVVYSDAQQQQKLQAALKGKQLTNVSRLMDHAKGVTGGQIIAVDLLLEGTQLRYVVETVSASKAVYVEYDALSGKKLESYSELAF